MGGTLLIDGLSYFHALDAFPLLLAETSRLAGLLNNVWLGLQVALGLGFVIFVHELGHFLAAKTFGVRCDKFYVGFDVPLSIGPIKLPRTLGKFQWGETEYGIGIIPLGGYVKMLGQDDDPRQAEAEAEKIRLGEGQEAPLDPRSYPAKPVWQRMIIISAGVVMNLIFAVFLAAVAYWVGVPYTPTVAGSTYGGGPAWVAGIETGDQIVQFGGMPQEDPFLRYNDFAVGVVMQGFEGQQQQLPLTVVRGEQRRQVTATPSVKYSPDRDIYRIGLLPPAIPKIDSPPFSPTSYLGQRQPDLQAGDLITAVNGEPLPIDARFGEALGSELTARLQANWETPVTVTVERPAKNQEGGSETLQLELPAVPVKTLGLSFAMGPITALQNGSPAEKAGFQVGDVLQEINGEKILNALQLPARVARLAGQEIRFRVQRPQPLSAGTSEQTADYEVLELSLPGPKRASFDRISERAGELTLAGLGIAFDARPEISAVDDPARERGVQVGDEFMQFQWVASEQRKQELAEVFTKQAFETQVIDASFPIASFYDRLQSLPQGAEIKCWLKRDGKTIDTTLKLEYAQDWYWHQRGIALSPLMHLHQTDSVANALNLGAWETSQRFTDVLDFLRLLVTGKIGAKGVGGPIAIAEAASSEASFGISRLLIFLTLLSANLAILNFLPIPALDGGHMVFLTAEAIRGKPVSEALQIRLTMAGVLGLLSLMAFVIVKDIMRLMS
ncbi:MAG: site-2 protease family protein [Planctomycetales bacterium]|nr:site-2 protease family protein [Planctomycetales bacterium]